MRTQSAFALLELLIVLAIIGILATILIPNVRQVRYEREQFINKLNSLAQFAWQQAIITHKTHRIAFDFQKRLITIAVESKKHDQKGEAVFVPVKEQFMASSYEWPVQIEIKQFIIEGFDEFKRFAGRPTQEVWFYVVSNGVTQNVIINGVDTRDLRADGKPWQFGLVLNPFSAQFYVYDTFQK